MEDQGVSSTTPPLCHPIWGFVRDNNKKTITGEPYRRAYPMGIGPAGTGQKSWAVHHMDRSRPWIGRSKRAWGRTENTHKNHGMLWTKQRLPLKEQASGPQVWMANPGCTTSTPMSACHHGKGSYHQAFSSHLHFSFFLYSRGHRHTVSLF